MVTVGRKRVPCRLIGSTLAKLWYSRAASSINKTSAQLRGGITIMFYMSCLCSNINRKISDADDVSSKSQSRGILIKFNGPGVMVLYNKQSTQGNSMYAVKEEMIRPIIIHHCSFLYAILCNCFGVIDIITLARHFMRSCFTCSIILQNLMEKED